MAEQGKSMSLCIKSNNAGGQEHCGLCNAHTDAASGPEIFIEGTWRVVCDECVEKHDPHLLAYKRKLFECGADRFCMEGQWDVSWRTETDGMEAFS